MPRIAGESALRWSHFHALREALDEGLSAREARTRADIPERVWRRLRGRWVTFEIEARLRAQDPEGVPVDLHTIDVVIRERLAQGKGRQPGATDLAKRKQRGIGKPKSISTGSLLRNGFYPDEGLDDE